MKESKNIVYALKSFIKNPAGMLSHDGFLLFPDKPRSDVFMQMAAAIKDPKQKAGAYEEYDFVKVDDYVSGRVHEQKHYYVRQVDVYTPNQDELEPISGVQELNSVNSGPEAADSLVQSVKEMEEMDEAANLVATQSSFKP